MVTKPEIIAAARAEHEKFMRAIGAFTLVWTNVESCLFSVLRTYAGVSDAVGRAIFSGTRAGVMMNYIEAIAHNTNMEARRSGDLQEIFKQLRDISTMRDRLVHNVDGSEHRFEEHDPTRRYLTNIRRVSRTGNEFEVLIGSDDIDRMRKDIDVCCWRLLAHTEVTNNPFVPTYFTSALGTGGQMPAWLYKPPQPIAKKTRSDASPQQQQRPPKPSRASPRKGK